MPDQDSDNTLVVILTMLFLACVCLPCAKAIREWHRPAHRAHRRPDRVPVALPVQDTAGSEPRTTNMPIPSAPPHPGSDHLVQMAQPVESLTLGQN